MLETEVNEDGGSTIPADCCSHWIAGTSGSPLPPPCEAGCDCEAATAECGIDTLTCSLLHSISQYSILSITPYFFLHCIIDYNTLIMITCISTLIVQQCKLDQACFFFSHTSRSMPQMVKSAEDGKFQRPEKHICAQAFCASRSACCIRFLTTWTSSLAVVSLPSNFEMHIGIVNGMSNTGV